MWTDHAAPLPRQGEGPGERAPVAARVVALVRRLFGMPDYPRYLDHQARCHPGDAVLSEKEFVRTEFERKYGQGGSRCC